MGELLLCNRPIAAMPYYIEALSLNIYSLEELSFVIEHHLFLMDEGFFNDELILWIEREIGEGELAENLLQSVRKEQGVTKLVELILNATGYLPYETGKQIITQIKELQNKTVFERRKMRADRYVENKKYINALLEYRRILQMEEECRENPIVCGNIWHNQGTVFARLFLFKEAKACFEMAYKYHMNIESIYHAMAACKYLNDDVELMALARKYGIDEQEVGALCEEWEKVSHCEQIADMELRIDTNPELLQLLQEWKKEYQKNCR